MTAGPGRSGPSRTSPGWRGARSTSGLEHLFAERDRDELLRSVPPGRTPWTEHLGRTSRVDVVPYEGEVVASLTPHTDAVAVAYARATGREAITADQRSGAAAVDSLLAIGLTGIVATRQLWDLASAGGRRRAFLLAEDLDALVHSLIKQQWRSGAIGTGLVDGLTGDAFHRERVDVPDIPSTPADVLRRGLRRVVVHGHGEGGHLQLGSTAGCGLADERERIDGRIIAGGCRLGPRPRCRRTASPGMQDRFALVDTDAELVVMLSCTSLVASDVLFPSNVRIVNALSCSRSSFAIGQLDRSVADPEVAAWAREAEWTDLGDAQQSLWSRRRGASVVVAHGDPSAPLGDPR